MDIVGKLPILDVIITAVDETGSEITTGNSANPKLKGSEKKMNARQSKKQLKNKIRLLTRDNNLMRDIIANHPQMQELYDTWTKPLHAITGTMDFQQYKVKRHISPYDPCDMEMYKRELTNTMVETIKDNIEFEVDTECGYPILTARIFIGRRRL